MMDAMTRRNSTSRTPIPDSPMPKKRQSASFESNEDELSRRWRQESERYVAAINGFVARGQKESWDKISEKDQPKDTRQPLAEAVLNAVRRANQSGTVEGLRERFPPAHEPFLDMLKENGQSLPVVILLDDGRIVMRIGAPHQPGKVVIIDDLKIESLPTDIISIGRSPRRQFFAAARKKGVTIHQGWDGPRTATLNWPTGMEGVPVGFNVKPFTGTQIVERLIPFDSGDRAILVCSDGMFVLTADKAIRLLPTEEQMLERFMSQIEDDPNFETFYNFDMGHAALSPNGKLIAAGHQDGPHFIFDADSLKVVGEIGNLSEYPHHAAFSSDGEYVALNSCWFHNGQTVGVPTRLLPGLKSEPYELDERFTKLEDGARVHAAVFRNDEFIIGDAYGYLRAFDVGGKFRWQHFIGSTVEDIDVSRDGKRLVVTTFAGFLSIMDLDTGTPDPFATGTSTHRERRRWLFWKKEPKPLAW
jgi:hypothetical protein